MSTHSFSTIEQTRIELEALQDKEGRRNMLDFELQGIQGQLASLEAADAQAGARAILKGDELAPVEGGQAAFSEKKRRAAALKIAIGILDTEIMRSNALWRSHFGERCRNLRNSTETHHHKIVDGIVQELLQLVKKLELSAGSKLTVELLAKITGDLSCRAQREGVRSPAAVFLEQLEYEQKSFSIGDSYTWLRMLNRYEEEFALQDAERAKAPAPSHNVVSFPSQTQLPSPARA